VVTRNYITKHEQQKDDGKHIAHCHHCHVLKQNKRAKKKEEKKGQWAYMVLLVANRQNNQKT
jgi:hypothetical protein